MTRPLIGLIGKKRAGKDSVAATLVGEFGFVRYAFADPLKATMLALDPYLAEWEGHPVRLSTLIEEHGWERVKDEYPEARRLLQAHGVAIRDHVDVDVWLRATMRRVEAETRPVVVTDVRFPNEADAIEAAGGVLVRIHRAAVTSSDTHPSETALDGRRCTFHIDNGGSLADLRAASVELAGHVLES